jgi:hypothetical protein
MNIRRKVTSAIVLGFLGLAHRTRHVDFHPGHEHKADWFLEINPLGQLPVLDDGGFVLRARPPQRAPPAVFTNVHRQPPPPSRRQLP